MRHASLATPIALAAGLWLAACASDPSVTDPAPPGIPVDFSGSAFRLEIDVASGRVSVQPPLSPSRQATGEGPSFSLIGSEGVQVHTGVCTWSSVPNNSKQKRCSFDLSLTNRLGATDLTTPTTFPNLPAGTTGIVVFPWTAAALGVPGGSATPTADWDYAPANLFNDFGGCSGGKTSDCYRSERYTSPLYGGSTSETRRVGFDVDKSAQSVQAYIVVAADLRDNPRMTARIGSTMDGYAYRVATSTGFIDTFNSNGGILVGAGFTFFDERIVDRGLYSFPLADLPAGVTIVSATLRLSQTLATDDGYERMGDLLVDHLDPGPSLDVLDFFPILPIGTRVGTLSTDATLGYKEMEVTRSVSDDLVNARARAGFLLSFANESSVGVAAFEDSENHLASGLLPQLVVVYRNR
jgi:hypothetical protein